jgi:hypothetical protein
MPPKAAHAQSATVRKRLHDYTRTRASLSNRGVRSTALPEAIRDRHLDPYLGSIPRMSYEQCQLQAALGSDQGAHSMTVSPLRSACAVEAAAAAVRASLGLDLGPALCYTAWPIEPIASCRRLDCQRWIGKVDVGGKEEEKHSLPDSETAVGAQPHHGL